MGAGDVQWGNVAEWLSAGAVPAALYIIVRDKRQQAKSQAMLFSAREHRVYARYAGTPEGKFGEVESTVTIHNGSQSPINGPMILGRLRRRRAKRFDPSAKADSRFVHTFLIDGEYVFVLPPGQSLAGKIYYSPAHQEDQEVGPLHTSEYLDSWEIFVSFTDAHGHAWWRDCRTGRLLKPQRWFKKPA